MIPITQTAIKELSEITTEFSNKIIDCIKLLNLSDVEKINLFFSALNSSILSMIDSQDISKEEKKNILNLVCEVMKKAGEDFKEPKKEELK